MTTYSEVLPDALRQFLEWLEVRQYSDGLTRMRRFHLGHFLRWCDARGVFKLGQVSRSLLERYQRFLFYYRKKNGNPLSARTQYGHLASVKSFLKWAARNHLVDVNPASDLVMPRLPQRLPREVLSPREMEAVLNCADVTAVLGLRDRALMEVLYSTGVRRAELAHLLLHDVDQERGTVMIREGKGKKDRMIPIGSRAIAWVDKYLVESRPHLVVEPDPQVLFLTCHGEEFGLSTLGVLVRDYIQASGVGKRGACHLFRHTMATGMLEGGADIRFIQALLGHVKLETTAIYTRVAIGKLKEIHTATHPAERPLPPRPEASGADGSLRAALLDDLAAEAVEEIQVCDEDVLAVDEL